MKISGEIIFSYNNEQTAKLIYDSLEVDNENFLKSQINENTTKYDIESKKLGNFLAIADDLIASEIVVEKIIKM